MFDMTRSSKAFCSLLCNWALAALKLYKLLHWTGGAMHLEDDFPLSVYSSGILDSSASFKPFQLSFDLSLFHLCHASFVECGANDER